MTFLINLEKEQTKDEEDVETTKPMRIQDLGEKDAVHCQTREEAERFCILMHREGLTRLSKDNYIETDNWNRYEKNTLYIPKLGIFSNIEKFEGYTIYNSTLFPTPTDEVQDVGEDEPKWTCITKDSFGKFEDNSTEYNDGKFYMDYYVCGNKFIALLEDKDRFKSSLKLSEKVLDDMVFDIGESVRENSIKTGCFYPKITKEIIEKHLA